MIFYYKSSENESKQVVEGNLSAVIKKIRKIYIKGQATLRLNQDEKKLAENIIVTFYGDYEPQRCSEGMQEVAHSAEGRKQ